jgi:hypothetical protein
MKELRVIKTARCIEDINKAADMGFIPLVKKLKPLKKLFRTTGVFRNKKTNKIEEAEDYVVYEQYGNITSYEDENEWELVVPFHSYYPYKFDSQYAAYLIPHDIEKGEKVILEDLIEDYYGGSFWSHHIRVESLQAIWAGEDFSILYDPKTDGMCTWVG